MSSEPCSGVSDWDDILRETLAQAAGEMSDADVSVETFLLEVESAEEIDLPGHLLGRNLSSSRHPAEG